MDNDFNKDDRKQDNYFDGTQPENNYFSNTDSASYSEYAVIDEEENAGGGSASGMQIASLVLGIIGIISSCCCTPLAIVLGGIGLALALIGNGRNKSNGVGIAGLVCSIIALTLGVLLLIIGIVMVLTGNNSFYNSVMSSYGY